MSYPQPTSSKSVLEGQEFFRINTPIESNGDLYEIDTSVKGIVIGPNSDIQNVRLYYYDVQVPNQVESALISVNDPFITRMNAFMAQQYPNLGATARLLVGPDDLVPNPGWALSNPYVQDPADYLIVHQPKLDLLCYHRDPPGLPATRGERQWQSTVSIADRGTGSGYTFYLFPHYRRKYFHVRFLNPSAGAGYSFHLHGLTFQPIPQTGAIFDQPATHTDAILLAEAITAGSYNAAHYVFYSTNTPDLTAVRAFPMGYYDYIQLTVLGSTLDGSDPATQLAFDFVSTDWI